MFTNIFYKKKKWYQSSPKKLSCGILILVGRVSANIPFLKEGLMGGFLETVFVIIAPYGCSEFLFKKNY
jgi:hypothetical protein